MVPFKKCGRCQEVKPAEDFAKNQKAKDGLYGYCKACHAAYQKAHLDADPQQRERGRKRSAWHYYNNPEYRRKILDSSKTPKKKAYKKAYESGAKARARQKNYREANKEKIRAYMNSEAGQTCRRKYAISARGKATANKNAAIRRARMASIICTLTWDEWLEIIREHGNRCFYCQREFDLFLKPTQDHVIPVSKGGHHIKENVRPACRRCNSSKNNRDFPTTMPPDAAV